jgi:hypothetical protein
VKMRAYYGIISGLIFFPVFSLASLTVLQHTSQSVMVEYRLEDLQESLISSGGREYVFFQFAGSVFEGTEGQPAVPHFETRLAVPAGAEVSYQISVVERQDRSNVDIIPLGQQDIRQDNQSLRRAEEIYSSPLLFPGSEVSIGAEYNFRGVNVIPLKIYPLQYVPLNHQVQLARVLRINFIFKNGSIQASPKTINRSEQLLLEKKLANPEQAGNFSYPQQPQLRKMSVNYDLSSGEWFRIPIKEEGVYQITGTFLASAGITINDVQINNIHIYNYGGYALPYKVTDTRPSDLNEIAIEVKDNDQDGLLDENDVIIFYGKGLGGWIPQLVSGKIRWDYYGNPDSKSFSTYYPSRFPYDDTNYYLFTFDNQPGKRIQTVSSPQVSNPREPEKFWDYYHFEEDEHNILSSGLDWYWLKMTGVSDKKTASFDLPQNISNDSVRIDFRFHGGSGSLYGTTETFRYNLKVLTNNQIILDNIFFTNNSTIVRTYQNPTLAGITSGNNALEIQHIGNLEGCEVYLDNFQVSLKRPFIAENNFLHFRDILWPNLPVEYQVSGLPAGENLLWDISDYANIRKIVPLQNGSTIRFQELLTEYHGKEYLAFSPGVIRNITAIERLENYPNLRDPSRKAEFLIITPKEFYESAEFLEIWRESQIPDRMETERVILDQIYQEFSSSVQDITAIRDFIKYAYDNWQDTLRYVLLFGDGHYDYRSIRLQNIKSYLPPFEITNAGEIDSRETDNFYVALGLTGDLGNIDPWLSVSRLPINDLQQIEIYRDKAEKYTNSFELNDEKNGWQTWLTFVSDDEKGGAGSNHELSYHLKPTEYIVNSYIPKKFNLSKIYLHDYEQVAGGLGRWKPKATEDLINQINRGTLMINFFGHGDADTWAHESVLNRSRDLPKFQNDYRLPLWVAATCTWGKYDNPSRPSMSEELIWRSRQGGIGVVSASRPVYVTGNTVFTINFYNYLFNNKSGTLKSQLVGKAFLEASSFSTNFQKYHLYGDPTLSLADPRYLIQIESIQPDTLKALSTVTVNARVVDSSGNFLPEFQGTAVLQVFDASDKRFVVDGSERYDYIYNGGTIFKGLVTVSDGELTGNFIVPKSIKYDSTSTGRLSIYAWSETSADAIGYNDQLKLFGTQTQISDQNGPEILISFKDNPNFFEGDFVSNQPTLLVELEDESGINLTGEVGHKIEIIIDGKVKKDVTEFFVYDKDSYRQGQLEYTLPALTSGTHQAEIFCWDNLNNFSEKEVVFRTSTANELQISEVVNYPNPFSDQTHFTFQLVSPSGNAEVTISVYTVTGRKIFEFRDSAFQGFNKLPRQGWDGRDWDGDLIANGVYLYKIVADDGTHQVEKIEKLAVVR